ncbi:MAG: response regulator [Segetibacter sp.]|nr:response regulator [Segetibacter sp.]
MLFNICVTTLENIIIPVKTKDMPPLHILFADDDSDETYLFNEALEHSGLDVVLSYANDGNSLVSFLKSNPLPDVVIIDINMPHKDGLEALAEIRNYPEFVTLPLIIYSTTTNQNIIETSFQKGANLFVVKPNNFDGMVQVVKKVCAVDWKSNPKPSREQFVITGE